MSVAVPYLPNDLTDSDRAFLSHTYQAYSAVTNPCEFCILVRIAKLVARKIYIVFRTFICEYCLCIVVEA